MLEQVWKNVVGDILPYVFEDGDIKVKIPRGHSMMLYDFGRLILRLESALECKIDLTGCLDEESLLVFKVSKRDLDKENDIGESSEEKEVQE